MNIASLAQSEIRDIILGMEMTPDSIQNKDIEDIDRQRTEAAKVVQQVNRTVNALGEEIITTNQTPYEIQKFKSHSDWRVRAISAANLIARTKHIYANPVDEKEDSVTFVLAKNILKKFISIADLRNQIAGYIFGVSSPENKNIKEIRCIVIPPQSGNNQYVTFPDIVAQSEYLKNLEPLGWIHTQGNETLQLSPQDLMIHAKLISNNPSLDAEKAVVVTVAFPPGACSVTAYRCTPAGYEWGKSNKDFNATNVEGYSPDFYEKSQIWLSEVFLGFFMVPDDQIWNYNFIGLRADHAAKINYMLSTPREFYHEMHRTSHFINFNKLEEEEEDDRGAVEEDYFK